MAQIPGQDTRLMLRTMGRWAFLAKRPLRADFATAAVLTGFYLLLAAFFTYVDVYNRHFFDAGYSRSYNFLRVVFVAYLFWMVYFSGWSLLPSFARGRRRALFRRRSRPPSASLPARRCGRS